MKKHRVVKLLVFEVKLEIDCHFLKWLEYLVIPRNRSFAVVDGRNPPKKYSKSESFT